MVNESNKKTTQYVSFKPNGSTGDSKVTGRSL